MTPKGRFSVFQSIILQYILKHQCILYIGLCLKNSLMVVHEIGDVLCSNNICNTRPTEIQLCLWVPAVGSSASHCRPISNRLLQTSIPTPFFLGKTQPIFICKKALNLEDMGARLKISLFAYFVTASLSDDANHLADV